MGILQQREDVLRGGFPENLANQWVLVGTVYF